MIYKEVTPGMFIDAFHAAGRGDTFSADGKRALYNYLDDLSEDIGEPIELDVIELYCYWTEYSDWEDWHNQHGKYYDDIASLEDLLNHTQVIFTGDYCDQDAPFLVEDF